MKLLLRKTGGRWSHNQRKGKYKGHWIYEDIGFSGRRSYAIDDRNYSYSTIREVKKAVDEMEAVGSSRIGAEFNPVKTVGSYDHQPAAEKALKRSKRKGGHVGFDVKKGKWVLVFPSARNPGHEYGVAVIGAPALSKAGFKTLADARGWLRHLNSRGVLAGRSHEILKIDNDAGRSEVVESKQNRANNPRGKRNGGRSNPGGYIADENKHVIYSSKLDAVRVAQVIADRTRRPVPVYSVSVDMGGDVSGKWLKRTVKPRAQKNPLPVGRYVTVKVKRLANGRVEVYKS